MQTADPEIFHVVVSVVKKFIQDLRWLLDKKIIWIDVADSFDGLL